MISQEQWEVYNKRRSYAERNRPPICHSGTPTVRSVDTPSSPASKPAASSPAPLPHSVPPPSEGPVLGEETTGEDPKRTRVSSPPLPVGEQGERAEDTDMELAADGSASPLPLSSEGGRMEPSPPRPPRIVTKASMSPRPNSHISHSCPQHCDSWSESEWVSMWFWRKAKHWGNNGHSAQKEKKSRKRKRPDLFS